MDFRGEVDETIQKEGLEQVTNLDEIESMIDEVIRAIPNNFHNTKLVRIGFSVFCWSSYESF